MHASASPGGTKGRTGPVRRWIRRGFFVWAIVSTLWMANSFRTRGVAGDLLLDNAAVTVEQRADAVLLEPRAEPRGASLLFVSGSGVAAAAYVPLLRPIAEAGHRVVIVKLPWRFALLSSHKAEAIARARRFIDAPAARHGWVVSGHSLGAALAGRLVHENSRNVAGLVLIGTTHPRDHDLSAVEIRVTKIYGTQDGVAPVERMQANQHLLPVSTRWIPIEGGNHSQFGHYGHQLFDGRASISREAQQAVTREALQQALREAMVSTQAGSSPPPE